MAVVSFVTHLYGTAAQLVSRNPLVPKGVLAAESDTGVVKVGDGRTRYNSLPTILNGAYAQVIGLAGTGIDLTGATDSTTALNVLLATATGKVAKGVPGSTYLISAPLVIPSGAVLDMTGCTVMLAAASNCNMLQNAAVTAVRSVADGAISSSGTTLTSATAAFTSADVGRSVTIAAATSGGYLLVTTIASVTNATTAEVALAAGATVTGAAVALYNRDVSVTVVGGTWARGSNNGSGSGLHSLLFRHVDGLVVRDAKVTSSAGKYAVSIADATKVRTASLDFASFSDGIHFSGPLTGVTVRDITGTTTDDAVAFTPQDWTAYADSIGDITDVVIENIEVTTGASCLLLLSGAAGALKRVRARNIGGVSTNTGRGAVYVGNDVTQAGTATGTLDDVEVNGVYSRVPNAAPLVVHRGINSGSVRLRGLYFDNSSTSASQIVQLTPSSTSTITALEISDSIIVNCGTARLVNIPTNLTVSTLKIEGVTMLTASVADLIFSQGTISDLIVRAVKYTNGTSYLLNMDQNTSTVITGRATFTDCHLVGSGSGGILKAIHASHTLPVLQVANCSLNNMAWLADVNHTGEIQCNGVVVASPGQGIVNARANTILTLSGGGNSLAAGSQGIKVTAGGKVSVRAWDVPPATTAGGFPTIAAGAGLGSSPTVVVAGSDRTGTLTLTPGSGAAAGSQAVVTFAGTWPQTPKIALTPTNSAAQAAGGYLSAKSTTAFTVSSANTPGGAMTFDYIAVA